MERVKKKQKIKKQRGIEDVKSRYGLRFITLWLVGQVLFFIVPIFNSLRYSFSNVKLAAGGIETAFCGLKHYKAMLTSNALYVDNLRDAVGDMFTSLPIIISLSLIMALVLNQKFRGRLIFRGIYFLPVIIASGVIMHVLKDDTISVPLFTISSGAGYQNEYGGMIDFKEILGNLDLPDQILKLFATYLGNVFGLIWSCGIQIILFLSGLQSIPAQLYEVSKIEGATKWEEFWYLTIPMLKDIILLVVVYTMIELFTSLDNPVIAQAYSVMSDTQVYDSSSAMLWGYFLLVGVVLGAVMAAYNHFCLKKWG